MLRQLQKTESPLNESESPSQQENSQASSTPSGEKEAEDKGKIRVFVYGSLKSQCGNNVLLQQVGAKCMGHDSITGEFTMMSFGGFPGVVRTPAAEGTTPQLTTIYGELYMMDAEGLASCDMLESHPDWYERRKFRTDVLDRNAWMYTLPAGKGYLDSSHYERVDGCVWRADQSEIDFWLANGAESDIDVA